MERKERLENVLGGFRVHGGNVERKESLLVVTWVRLYLSWGGGKMERKLSFEMMENGLSCL